MACVLAQSRTGAFVKYAYSAVGVSSVVIGSANKNISIAIAIQFAARYGVSE